MKALHFGDGRQEESGKRLIHEMSQGYMIDYQMNDADKHCTRFQERERALWRGLWRYSSSRAAGNRGDGEVREARVCGGACIKDRDE